MVCCMLHVVLPVVLSINRHPPWGGFSMGVIWDTGLGILIFNCKMSTPLQALSHLQAVFPGLSLPDDAASRTLTQLLDHAVARLPLPKHLPTSLTQMKTLAEEQEFRTQNSFLEIGQLGGTHLSHLSVSHLAAIDEGYFEQHSTAAGQRGTEGISETKYIEYIDEVWWSMEKKQEGEEALWA